jgi:hypothetical protein
MRGMIVRADGTSEDLDVPMVTNYRDRDPTTCIDCTAIARAIGAGRRTSSAES